MMNDLSCRYDTRASFYGKAKTISETISGGSMLSLYSYDTMVAYIQFYENIEHIKVDLGYQTYIISVE